MDNLEFLDGSEEPNAETQPEEVTAETPTEEETQPEEPTPEAKPRDEHGRFKKKEDEAPVMVPLQALHETRDKLKSLEAELMQLRQPQTLQQQAQQSIPDVFEDPDGFYGHIQNTVQQITLNDRLNLSEEMVRQSAGDETVNAAQEWARQQFAANPVLQQQFYQQRNPYGFIVKEYQRQQALASIGDDPSEIEAFKAWKAAQAQLQQPNPQPQAAPPQSIASAPSAGGPQSIAIGPGVAFAEVIK